MGTEVGVGAGVDEGAGVVLGAGVGIERSGADRLWKPGGLWRQ